MKEKIASQVISQTLAELKKTTSPEQRIKLITKPLDDGPYAGYTPLLIAIDQMAHKELKQMFDAFSLQQKQMLLTQHLKDGPYKGFTLFFFAVWKGQDAFNKIFSVWELMLDGFSSQQKQIIITQPQDGDGPDPDDATIKGCTPIILAIDGMWFYALELMFDGFSLEQKQRLITEPLKDGAYKGHTPLYSAILGSGYFHEPSEIMLDGFSPQQKQTLITQPLKDGAFKGCSFLYVAAWEARSSILKELLKGFSPQQKQTLITQPQNDGPHKGRTPLYAAAQYVMEEFEEHPLDVMLEGISPQQKQMIITQPLKDGPDKGCTPLYAAAQNGEAVALEPVFEGISLQQKQTLITQPLEDGPHKGYTPLYAAVQKKDSHFWEKFSPALEIMLKGFSPQQKQRLITQPIKDGAYKGCSLLYVAACNDVPFGLTAMLEGMSPQQKQTLITQPQDNGPHKGYTPLCAATHKGHVKVLQTLLTAIMSHNEEHPPLNQNTINAIYADDEKILVQTFHSIQNNQTKAIIIEGLICYNYAIPPRLTAWIANTYMEEKNVDRCLNLAKKILVSYNASSQTKSYAYLLQISAYQTLITQSQSREDENHIEILINRYKTIIQEVKMVLETISAEPPEHTHLKETWETVFPSRPQSLFQIATEALLDRVSEGEIPEDLEKFKSVLCKMGTTPLEIFQHLQNGGKSEIEIQEFAKGKNLFSQMADSEKQKTQQQTKAPEQKGQKNTTPSESAKVDQHSHRGWGRYFSHSNHTDATQQPGPSEEKSTNEPSTKKQRIW